MLVLNPKQSTAAPVPTLEYVEIGETIDVRLCRYDDVDGLSRAAREIGRTQTCSTVVLCLSPDTRDLDTDVLLNDWDFGERLVVTSLDGRLGRWESWNLADSLAESRRRDMRSILIVDDVREAIVGALQRPQQGEGFAVLYHDPQRADRLRALIRLGARWRAACYGLAHAGHELPSAESCCF